MAGQPASAGGPTGSPVRPETASILRTLAGIRRTLIQDSEIPPDELRAVLGNVLNAAEALALANQGFANIVDRLCRPKR